ncbi:MAG: HDOD domain-containing protein [Azospira sp.]|jgi:EAL and modified HD-GYP domain-containing signal transduction protein|nr:HDOD domain-containing protein [Azospira sp.]
MNTQLPPRSPLLLRQPLLDAKQEPAGYALHFADATANEIAAAFAPAEDDEASLGSALSGRPLLLRANAALVMSEAVIALPKNVVLELDFTGDALTGETLAPELLDRCRLLHAAGRPLALPADAAWSTELLPLASFAIIDAGAGDETLAATVGRLTERSGLRLLADRVESPARMAHCRELGCELFRGLYFARLRPSEGRSMNASQLGIIRLLNQVAREADEHDIEEGFKREPGLTVNLLRLVNAVGIGAAKKVDSLRHAIAILGRKQMMLWLQLLLMASPDGRGAPERNPLLQLAAQRGGLMERLAAERSRKDRALAEEAFLVGIMSLMPAALGQSIDDILAQIPVAERVHRALTAHDGELGPLLALAEALDDGDAVRCDAIMAGLPPLSRESVSAHLRNVLVWLHGDGGEV